MIWGIFINANLLRHGEFGALLGRQPISTKSVDASQ
jgi:hypothetical protein